jgi:hypothetical protein
VSFRPEGETLVDWCEDLSSKGARRDDKEYYLSFRPKGETLLDWCEDLSSKGARRDDKEYYLSFRPEGETLLDCGARSLPAMGQVEGQVVA